MIQAASLLFILFITFSSVCVTAQSISVSGNWSFNVSTTDLTEAGNNYSGNHESSNNQVLISHSAPGNPAQVRNRIWTVEVHMLDIDWHPQLQLFIKRTDDGTADTRGGCQDFVTGGLIYQQITSSPTYFYNGRCNHSNVPIQFELRNASVTMPANNYTTEIVYTITFTQM